MQAIQKIGFTLRLRKCEFAKSSKRFVGHIVGSGLQCLNAECLYEAVIKLKEPETKKEVRMIVGFFFVLA